MRPGVARWRAGASRTHRPIVRIDTLRGCGWGRVDILHIMTRTRPTHTIPLLPY